MSVDITTLRQQLQAKLERQLTAVKRTETDLYNLEQLELLAAPRAREQTAVKKTATK